MIAFILSNSRFLFRNNWLHYWLEENICNSNLLTYVGLLSDNIACAKRSYGKTKCKVNGALVTVERQVKNGVHLTRPDTTRANSPPFFHSTAAIVPCTICSVLLFERLEKVSDNNSD